MTVTFVLSNVEVTHVNNTAIYICDFLHLIHTYGTAQNAQYIKLLGNKTITVTIPSTFTHPYLRIILTDKLWNNL